LHRDQRTAPQHHNSGCSEYSDFHRSTLPLPCISSSRPSLNPRPSFRLEGVGLQSPSRGVPRVGSRFGALANRAPFFSCSPYRGHIPIEQAIGSPCCDAVGGFHA
jgi:hypothetical protein